MILFHQTLTKSEKVFKAVINELSKQDINLDGVIESFNHKEQGYVLKIYDKYNPDIDICIWAYLPKERDYTNQMKVIIGRHSNCNDINLWQGDNLISEIFSDVKAIEMHRQARDFIMDTIKENLDRNYELPSIKI